MNSIVNSGRLLEKCTPDQVVMPFFLERLCKNRKYSMRFILYQPHIKIIIWRFEVRAMTWGDEVRKARGGVFRGLQPQLPRHLLVLAKLQTRQLLLQQNDLSILRQMGHKKRIINQAKNMRNE